MNLLRTTLIFVALAPHAQASVACWEWMFSIAELGPTRVVGSNDLPVIAGIDTTPTLAAVFRDRGWKMNGNILRRNGERVISLPVGLYRLPPAVVNWAFFENTVKYHPLNALALACRMSRAAPYDSADFIYRIAGDTGDLSATEIGAIQKVADEWNEPIAVFGSAANSQRRNRELALPMGKGEGEKSDIDYWFPTGMPSAARAQLPDCDGKTRTSQDGLPFPAVIFSPGNAPFSIRISP